MGKYSKVLKTLPRGSTVDPSHQERVDQCRQEITTTFVKDKLQDVSFLAELYANARAEKEDLEGRLSEVQVRLDAITALAVARYEETNTQTVTLASGVSVSWQPEPRTIVDDRDAVRRWAIDNDLERSLTLHASTLKALNNDRLLRGEPEIDGTHCYAHDKLILRKARS